MGYWGIVLGVDEMWNVEYIWVCGIPMGCGRWAGMGWDIGALCGVWMRCGMWYSDVEGGLWGCGGRLVQVCGME